MHSVKISSILVLLTALILITGISAYKALSSSAKTMENHIAEIESSAKTGDWSGAEKQLSLAKKDWSGTEKLWSVLIDHFEIDNIDTALSKMEKYIDVKNTPLALAEAATLMQYIKHIPDKEAFRIKNIF